MEKYFMEKFPHLYIQIVNEIENYVGATFLTDRILHRVLYRINLLTKDEELDLTEQAIKRLTKRAAHELLSREKKVIIQTNDDVHELLAQTKFIQFFSIHDFAFLAESNVEQLIIHAWANGWNDSDIAQLLSDKRGGSLESNRSKLRRYKAKLRSSHLISSLLVA